MAKTKSTIWFISFTPYRKKKSESLKMAEIIPKISNIFNNPLFKQWDTKRNLPMRLLSNRRHAK